MDLWPHQERAIQAAREAISRGAKRIILASPTGSGKTVIGASILRGAIEKNKYGLFIAPRREIIRQTSKKLDEMNLGHGVIMASDRSRRSVMARVQVCSVQTLYARLKKKRMQPPSGHVIIVDEAHLSIANSWQYVLDQYPGAIVIGLTATPCRGDGRGLGGMYDELIEVTTISELIEQGILVPSKIFAPSIPDLTGVKVDYGTGDYNRAALQEAMDNADMIGNIYKDWKERCSDRKTVVFTAGVAHSLHVEEVFARHKVKIGHIDGSTPSEKRDQILSDLAAGKIQVVTNAQVLQEGWDCPDVSAMIDASPTKSYSRYLQKIGRVLRSAKNKTDAIIIDHAGNVYRHGYPEEAGNWTLDPDVKVTEVRKKTNEKKPTITTCRNCFQTYTSLPACPNCGCMPKRGSEAINLREGRLREVPKKKKETSKSKQEVWLECLFKASHRGLKVGAAAHMYKKIIGSWPNGLNRVPKGKDQWQLTAKSFINATKKH